MRIIKHGKINKDLYIPCSSWPAPYLSKHFLCPDCECEFYANYTESAVNHFSDYGEHICTCPDCGGTASEKWAIELRHEGRKENYNSILHAALIGYDMNYDDGGKQE